MRLAVSFLAVVALAAALAVGLASCSNGRLDGDLEAAADMAEPAARIAATAEIVQGNSELDSAQYQRAAQIISDAAFEMGGADALAAVCDSLLATDLPREFELRVMGDLHNAVVYQGFYAEEDKDVFFARATDLARELSEADGVPSDVLSSASSMQMYALDFVPPEQVVASRGHWLPYRLAERAFNSPDGPEDRYRVLTLSGGLGSALSRISDVLGPERAVAVADSLLAAGPQPAKRAVILANRYDVASGHDDDAARESARELAEVGRLEDTWPLLRSVSLDLVDRGLDAALALELAEAALDLVQDRADSGHAYFAIGFAHRALDDHEAAADALEMSVRLGAEMPEADDPRVAALLSVYQEWNRNDRAIDFLALLLARSVEPDPDLRERLGGLLESEGRSPEEIPDLVTAHRYDGVRPAPDFTLVGLEGDEFTLSDRSGKVVVLCFWGHG